VRGLRFGRCDRAAGQGYRRYRCRACGRGINERSSGVLNRVQYPSDVIALVVLTGNMKYQRAAQRITSAVNCRPLED
jgi:hypothetical protein